MPIYKKGLERLFDYKEMFELYIDLGSYEKVSKYCTAHGKINPETGRGPTPQTVRLAGFHYAAENLQDALNYVLEKEVMPENEFKAWIVQSIYPLYTRDDNTRKFDKWLRKNKLQDFAPEYFQRIDVDDPEILKLQEHLKNLGGLSV